MKRVELDHSIYIFRTLEETIIIAIYVDDLLLVWKSIKIINDLKIILKHEYKMKKLGEAWFSLGINIGREKCKLSISQEEYLKRILKRFGMNNSKGTSTPL